MVGLDFALASYASRRFFRQSIAAAGIHEPFVVKSLMGHSTKGSMDAHYLIVTDEMLTEAKLKLDLNTSQIQVMNTCKHNFQELFQALVHLKIMRTYIDGVLRFGIPPKFFLGIIEPGKKFEQKIKDNLTSAFAEAHLTEMYGAKEDANDEDFFPYVMNTLNEPSQK